MPEEIKTPQPQIVSKKSLNPKNILVGSVVGLVVVGLIGAGFYYYLNQQSKNRYDTATSTNKTATKSASKVASKSASATSSAKETTPTIPIIPSGWETYNNKTYNYTISFPNKYEIPQQTDKEKSQSGVDNNMCVTDKQIQVCLIVISVFDAGYTTDGDATTLNSYDAKIKTYPDRKTITYSLVHNNQVYVIELTSKPSSEIQQILSTFRFL